MSQAARGVVGTRREGSITVIRDPVVWDDSYNIPGARYTVEVDAFHAISAGRWAEEINRTFRIYHNISGQTHYHSFVGAQRGRWRVRAQIGGQNCSWSPWSYFRFTV